MFLKYFIKKLRVVVLPGFATIDDWDAMRNEFKKEHKLYGVEQP